MYGFEKSGVGVADGDEVGVLVGMAGDGVEAAVGVADGESDVLSGVGDDKTGIATGVFGGVELQEASAMVKTRTITTVTHFISFLAF
jgi:hypothetical protein